MVSEITNEAHKTTDDTSSQHKDQPKNNELNLVNLVKPGDARSTTSGANTADQFLTGLQIVDSKGADQTAPGSNDSDSKNTNGDSKNKNTDSTQPAQTTNPNEETRGATTVKKDDQGNAKEYANGDYTLSKHDDGKWYYHQNGEGHDFVEVKGDSIKMDDQGKVSYSESGLFGKDNQTLGDGSTGFVTSLTSAASHVADQVVNHPLDTFNSIAFAPAAAVDAIAGTHVIQAIGEIEKGAVNEVIHNPGEVLKNVAIGAAIGALTVATGGGALVALGVGAAAIATTELVKNDGDINGVINDAKSFGNSVVNWGNDFATIAGPGQHTQEETEAAKQGLHELGAFGAETIAGAAGGIAGGAGAAAVGLEGAIPRLATNVASRLEGSTSRAVPTGETQPMQPPPSIEELSANAHFYDRVVTKDGQLEYVHPNIPLQPGDTFIPATQRGLGYSAFGDSVKISSPVSARMVQQVADGLAEVPAGVRNQLLNNEFSINLSNKVLDAYPELGKVPARGYDNGMTYENSSAFFEPTAKEVVMGETYKNANGLTELSRNVSETVRHEFGHAFDQFKGMLSTQNSFNNAWARDWLNIQANAPQEVKTALAYFIKNVDANAAKSEAFAESFSVLTNRFTGSYNGARFQQWFPNTLQYLDNSIIDAVS